MTAAFPFERNVSGQAAMPLVSSLRHKAHRHIRLPSPRLLQRDSRDRRRPNMANYPQYFWQRSFIVAEAQECLIRAAGVPRPNRVARQRAMSMM